MANYYFCTNCGKQINSESNFCGSCGKRSANIYPQIKLDGDELSPSSDVMPKFERKKSALNFYIPGLLFFISMLALLIYAITFQNPITEYNQSKAQTSENTVAVAAEPSPEKAAQDLVEINTQRQDSCYQGRTSVGDDPQNARAICLAKFPTSLEWAKSVNHEMEESCFQGRVFYGDNEPNARLTCLAKYPIR
jgi:hypothetical protein